MFDCFEMFESIESHLEEPNRMELARQVMDEGITLIKDENKLLPINPACIAEPQATICIFL